MKVLFVCTGNTCRSPLAEAVARKEAKRIGLKDVEFASAGTGAWVGATASEGSVLVALERGMDLSGHKAQPLTDELVQKQDLILGMAPQHVAAARDLGAADRSFLLDSYASMDASSAPVDDPYGGDLGGYRAMADTLEDRIKRLVARLASRPRGDQ